MTFNINTEAHEQRIIDLARKLAQDEAPWRSKVTIRYGTLLRIRADRDQAALDRFVTRKADAPNPGRAEEYIKDEIARIRAQRELSADLINGVTDVLTPPRCEAICRIYEETTGEKLS